MQSRARCADRRSPTQACACAADRGRRRVGRRWRRRSPAGDGRAAAPSQASAKCPVERADEGRQAGRDHVLARDEPGERGRRSRRSPTQFNSSQSDVKVKLVNQIELRATRSTKYMRRARRRGDLPDLVQIEDTGLAADDRHADGAARRRRASRPTSTTCPTTSRGSSTTTRSTDTLWPMPFNVSNPVFYYNKHAFEKAGPRPREAADDARRGEERGAEARRHGRHEVRLLGIKLDPWYLEQWLAKAGKPYVNNGNGRQGARHGDRRSTTRPASRSSRG